MADSNMACLNTELVNQSVFPNYSCSPKHKICNFFMTAIKESRKFNPW